MIWRTPIDYHGSRTYGPAVATQTMKGRIKLIAELCAASARQQFKAMLRFGIAPAEPAVLDQRGFSLLGSTRAANRRHDVCPFPQAPEREHGSAGRKAR